MAWLSLWLIALANSDQRATESSDRLKPATWAESSWGPAATRARLSGELPSPTPTPLMAMRSQWGLTMLRDGDIVFRQGDARTLWGFFPLSRFIARASGSPFSHTGIVSIEDGTPVIYDCSSPGVRRQPFEVWMIDCVGAVGVKRLRPEHRRHIPGVIGYCREKFYQQAPFDYEFQPDDAAFYCLELTEKAFRSQGLVLSQPVRIGDWEYLTSYPLTTCGLLYGSRLLLKRPFTLDQPVYLPGTDSQGIWASSLLETVFGPEPKVHRKNDLQKGPGFSLRGDAEIVMFVLRGVRRSYKELPMRWALARISQLMDRYSQTSLVARAAPQTDRRGPSGP
jgi:hypothetical protein